MNTATAKTESGASAKPAETTVPAAAAPAAAQPDSATLDGVTTLLKGAFDATDAAPAPSTPASEVPAGEEGGAAQRAEETQLSEEEKRAEEARLAEETAAAEAAARAKGEVDNSDLPADVQETVNKRIGSVIRQREQEKTARTAAEQERDRLKAENDQLRSAAPVKPILAPQENEADLEKMQKNGRAFVNAAEAVLDGSALPEQKEQIERYMQSNRLDEAGLKRSVRDVRDFMADELPRKREQLKTFRSGEATAEPVVKKFFPWMDDPKSPDYQATEKVMQLFPEIRTRTPAHRVARGIYALGLREFARLQAEAAAKGTIPATTGRAAAPRTPPPKPPTAGSPAASRAPQRDAQETQARERLAKAPTKENVTDLLKAVL